MQDKLVFQGLYPMGIRPCFLLPYGSDGDTFQQYLWYNPDYRIETESSIRDFHAFISGSTRSVIGTDCVGRYTVSEILFHPVANLTCAVSHRIQADYTVCNTFCRNSLTLPDGLRIKALITVTGSRYGYFTQWSLNLLLHLSVTTVTHLTFFFCQMCIHFNFQSCIQYTFQ